MAWWGIAGAIAALLLVRCIIVLASPLGPPAKKRSQPCNTVIVLGSGGHTAEMLNLIAKLNPSQYSPRTYITAETDAMSETKAKTLETGRASAYSNGLVFYKRIPRSREVGQSYFTSILTTLRSQLYCIPLMLRLRPELVLVNGPGTCVPIVFLAFLLKVLCLRQTRVVYVESIARVESLSLSGKILHLSRLADDFLVQWPQLIEKYPRAQYIGRVV